MNNENPLVSVVIMTVNRQNLLKNAIESVFKQTFQDLEIICILGMRSNDQSEEMLTELRAKNMIKFAKNYGSRIDARNIAFNMARGKYICFLDDDDSMLNTRIQKQVEILEDNPDIDICSCSTMLNDSVGLMHTFKAMNTDDIYNLIKDNNDIDEIVNFQSCMFRKDSIERAFTNERKFDDLFIAGGEGQMFLYECLLNKNLKFYNTPDTIYIYYVGQAQNSLSNRSNPVFYNEHLFEKSFDEKLEFIRRFRIEYPEIKQEATSNVIKTTEVKEEIITEAPTEKPKRKYTRKKKEDKVEEPTKLLTKKRGRPKKVKE